MSSPDRVTWIDPPAPDRRAVERWVSRHLGDLVDDDVVGSRRFSGGQRAADRALADLDISGYARRRSNVQPVEARGASYLSPYIRHGLLTLRRVWDAVDDAPGYDRFRFQGELLWQDHARHWYALQGADTAHPMAYEPVRATDDWDAPAWWREMRCVRTSLDELEADGWVVNQSRMWLASQWVVRAGQPLADGEDAMFRHLLDGSRAANRLGWQWCAGTTRPRAHGFAKRQVTRRAPELCAACSLQHDCPIRSYTAVESRRRVERPAPLDPGLAFGPLRPPVTAPVDAVWLTAESLGDGDPALSAHPGALAVFVFDRPLLDRLRLSSKRLVFLTECLADLASRREVRIAVDRPHRVLDEFDHVATTHAPVPGFRRISNATAARLIEYPWLWLRPPTDALRQTIDATGRLPSFRDWCRLTKPD